MKSFLPLLLAFVLVAAGCAQSDSSDTHRHHARHHHPTSNDPNAPTPAPGTAAYPPAPQDAGVPNPDLGPSSRDSQGHPAISDY